MEGVSNYRRAGKKRHCFTHPQDIDGSYDGNASAWSIHDDGIGQEVPFLVREQSEARLADVR